MRWKKYGRAVVLSGMLIATMLAGAKAAESDLWVRVDNVLIADEGLTELQNAVTFAPLRAVAEQMGWTVGWNGQTRTTVVTTDRESWSFAIGSDYITNSAGETRQIPAAVFLKNSRTMIPVRALCEAFDAKVEYFSPCAANSGRASVYIWTAEPAEEYYTTYLPDLAFTAPSEKLPAIGNLRRRSGDDWTSVFYEASLLTQGADNSIKTENRRFAGRVAERSSA